MIELKNVSKVYASTSGPIQALKEISLTIQEGEIFGIIGLSGAGKSTLIRCINMLEKPTSGSVTIGGQDLTKMNEKTLRDMRKNMGMIFQHFNLLSSRTVYQNVAFPLELAKKSPAEIEKVIMPLLELVGLTDKKDKYPAQLSGGQKQRVGIARALASRPAVLLCDEATSALDPKTTHSILELLKDINKKLNLTIVLITHEMEVIKTICDQVAVIEAGQIVETGSVLEVFTRPQSPTTLGFVQTTSKFNIHDYFPDAKLSSVPVPDSTLVLKLSFIGQSAEEPIIATMTRKFNVDTNILFGNIDHIQKTPCGTLVLELSGEQPAIQNSLNFLKTRDLGMEVIGYVARNNLAIG